MQNFSQNLNNKFRAFVKIVVVTLFFIVIYLFHLQINLNLNFFKISQKNFTRYEKVSSPRGNIVDSFGKLLATNRPVDNVYWQGTGNKSLTVNQIKTIKKISQIGNLSQDVINSIIYTERKNKRIDLINDANFEQISQLTELLYNDPNIIIERQFKRFYPYSSLASHVIGFLSLDLKSQGKTGIEQICQDILKGSSGKIVNIINSAGYSIKSYEAKKAILGNTIETHLNVDLQKTVEELFSTFTNVEKNAGSCILLDPQNGALEVIYSFPSFDPNIFLKKISHADWDNLLSKKCFINRAFRSSYPPASLFKLVTLATASELNLINNKTVWNCTGKIKFGNRFYHCARSKGHGLVNSEKAIAYSCNIPFYDIAQKLSINSLAKYAHNLGLGEKTNIIFQENTGLIPTNSWKLENKGENWWPGEKLSLSIGQSFLLATPIQIAKMISGICEGYFVKPRVLKNEQIVKSKINLQTKTLDLLKNLMKNVTSIGTARKLNKLSNFKFYAKTGTAQTSNLNKRSIKKRDRAHAWFVSYFQYKNYPPKTIVIFIEHAGTTKLVSDIAENFFHKYAKYLDNYSG